MTASEQPSYTIGDLEQETGFDRRTIAYYVQEELLPRVGRRGPRTRYPRLFRDRLLFVRRVREAEEAGTVPPVSLSEMRKIFERMAPPLVAGVADGRIAVTPELVGEASTALRMPEMRRAGKRRMALRRRMESRLMESEGSPAYAPPREPVADLVADVAPDLEDVADAAPVPGDVAPVRGPEAVAREVAEAYARRRMEARPRRSAEARLADTLAKLQKRSQRRRRRREHDADMDTWTRIEITREIALSVRGLDEDDRKLAERVRKAMRRVLGRGGGGR